MSKINGKIKAPKGIIGAGLRADSYNEDERTIELSWSSGARVKRSSFFDGDFYEELSMKKSAVRMERLKNKAPFLIDHTRSVSANIGSVIDASIKSGVGYAKVKLSSREEFEGIIRDIRDGVLNNISVGYRVHKFEDVTKKSDEIPVLRAVDWEPFEITLTTVPAEAGVNSQVRSEKENEAIESLVIDKRESEMPKTKKKDETRSENDDQNLENQNENDEIETDETRSKSEKTDETVDNTRENDENIDENRTSNQENNGPQANMEDEMSRKTEKERILGIQKACKVAGLDDDFASRMIDEEKTLDEARGLIFAELEKKNNEKPTNNTTVEVNDVDQRNLRIEAASNAILNKVDSKKHELTENGRDFRGMSLTRMAEEILRNQGQNVRGLTSNELAERALHHSSDFVEILANVTNKTLRAGYEEQAQTFQPFTRMVSVSDFKQISRTQLSAAPKLEKVNEAGEFKSGSMEEGAEKYQVETYGKIVGVTRQMLVNDDLDAFSRLAELYGRRARDLESDLIWGIITSNPLMGDGKNLFHADHGNLAGAGGAISITTLGAMRAAMRLQKGLKGELININAEYLVVPAALETVADQFVSTITPDQSGNVNPFANRLRVISEPRLDADSATAWYGFSSVGNIDMFELARISGEEGPVISSREGFSQDGVQFKVRYDLGVKAIDWRGFYKNPGV